MVNPRPDRSRLGDLLVEMRLVDPETLSAALVEHRASGRRLPRVLADRRVLDEERLAKAVAAKLGLEAVNVGTLKIHERVLQLIPAEVAQRYGVLPIAIKRTNQSELLYLVMVDPLDTEAIGEVQRLTGRQVRVLMATATDVDLTIEAQYRKLNKATGTPPPATGASQSSRPPPLRRSEGVKAGDASPPIVRGTPASPAPRYPKYDQATLIDSPPPPEIAALVATLDRGHGRAPAPTPFDEELVMPSELDPPEVDANTRIDPGPFAKLSSSDDAPTKNPPLADRDWDLAVQAWGDFGSGASNREVSDALQAPVTARAVSQKRSDPATSEGSLDSLDLDIAEDDLGDDEEDLKTSQLELTELGAAELRRQLHHDDEESSRPLPAARPGAAKGDRRLASTLEVPVDVADDHHPFDGPSVEEIPTGLERTGIIPAIDWEREEFDPPPLETKKQSSDTHALIGVSDIPMSQDAVRARFSEHHQARKMPSEDDVIEAIEEVSLEPIESAEVVQFEEPEEYDLPKPSQSPKSVRFGGTAVRPEPAARGLPPASPKPLAKPGAVKKLPGAKSATPRPTLVKPILPRSVEPAHETPQKDAPIPAAEDSDADRIPVIEPSSLMSLMDDGAENSASDTGADVAPFGNWQDGIPAPATRLFDESNRQIVRAPPGEAEKVGNEEEPTNPRIDTSSVQAALASEQGTLTATPDPLPTVDSTDDVENPVATPRDSTTVDRTDSEIAESVAPQSEEPTPSEDTVDRNAVLSALDGAFWEPSASSDATPDETTADVEKRVVEPVAAERAPKPAVAERPPKPAAAERPSKPVAAEPQDAKASEESIRLVNELVAGDSLTSAARAQVLLALGRVLIEKGLITRDELARALDQ